MRGIKTGKRIAACLLAVVLTAGMLAGCGGGGSLAGGGADKTTDREETAQGEEQETGMGRYVEKDVELNGSALTDWNSRLFRQEDGSFLLADNSGFILRSTDNGASWTREDVPWLARMKEENKYILTMAIGRDGTAAVVWTEPEEGTGDSGNGVQLKMDMQLTVVKPDGTEIPAEIKLEADDMWVNSVTISDEGRIIVSTLGSNLYEVNMDGSSSKFLNVAEGSPSLVRFHGDLMLMDGWGWDTPILYDMEEKTYIEDEVLTAFVRENYGSRDSSSGRSYDLFLVAGEDDAIYLAGQTGVYRHVLGGSPWNRLWTGA